MVVVMTGAGGGVALLHQRKMCLGGHCSNRGERCQGPGLQDWCAGNEKLGRCDLFLAGWMCGLNERRALEVTAKYGERVEAGNG